MKNKGRKHLAVNGNCKGMLTFITRSITKMSRSKDRPDKAYIKKKWSKRVRGYFKTSKFKSMEAE